MFALNQNFNGNYVNSAQTSTQSPG